MTKLTIQTFKANLPGTGGNQSIIAQKVGVDRSAVTKFLNKHPGMRDLLEQEAERIIDVAENVVEADITDKTSKTKLDTAKWKLLNSKRGKNRGYGPKTETDQTIHSDNKLDVKIIKVVKKEEDLDEPEISESVAVAGVPKAGKTTLADGMSSKNVYHTDDLIGKLDWSGVSAEVATWFDKKEKFIIEGVAVPRALRKWMRANDGKPCDKLIWMEKPHLDLNPGQLTMAKGCITVFKEIEPELVKRGVIIERA